MRFLLFLIFFSFSFSCNTTNYQTAYKDYYKYQKKYILAILDDNEKNEAKYLKELIECGKYLRFNVKKLEAKLKKLQKTEKKTYVKILSTNPLKIKTSNHYKIYNLHSKGIYKKVIDVYNAIFPKNFFRKKYNNINVKIAQYNKSIVRVVLYSKKPIKTKIKKLKNILSITFAKTKAIPLFKKKKIIVIDPGHGGKDSGGIGIGRRKEKIAVLQIAKKLKYFLQKEGYIVYLTRSTDIFKPLKWRTHFANRKKADLFISIHCNIAPKHIKYPHGIETYFLSPTRSERAIRVAKIENKEVQNLNYLDQRVILGFLNKDRIIASTKFAIDVQKGMINTLKKYFKNVKDGGVKPAPFWVLVGTQMPAILIETGYLTNPIEAKRLFNPTYQNFLAKGIAKGVKNYFKKNP